MSIIIIAFPAAPKVDPECKRKDEELNRLLEQKVTGIYISLVIFSYIMLKYFLIRTTTSMISSSMHFSILDIVKENENDIEFHAVFQRLSEEEIPDLPPGGGLYSKYVAIYLNTFHLYLHYILYHQTFIITIILFFQKTMHRRGL